MKYYMNKDISANHDLKDYYFDDNIELYSKNKIEVQNKVTNIYKLEKKNYKIETNTKIVERIEDKILVEIPVEVSFNYVNEEVDSGYGELVQVILLNEDDGYRIRDMLVAYNYYDKTIRGENIELFSIENKNYRSGNTITINGETLIDNYDKSLMNNKETMFEDILEKYEKMEYVKSQIVRNDYQITPFALNLLNRTNIVNYARNNYNKTNPTSGRSGTPYYDMSKISGAYDCTNFVSHPLLAGGATINNTQNKSTGWYYYSLDNRSYSWAGVNELHGFLTQNRTRGPAARSYAYRSINEKIGD